MNFWIRAPFSLWSKVNFQTLNMAGYVAEFFEAYLLLIRSLFFSKPQATVEYLDCWKISKIKQRWLLVGLLTKG